MDEPLLFKYYPKLKKRIGYMPLAKLPSPVEKCRIKNINNLWIKRDDINSEVYGGNKIRKLEFIIPEVIRKKKKRVVTLGGIGTNHGLATAIYGKKAGLDCKLLLFEQPVTKNVKQNLKCFTFFNAELLFYKSLFKAAWAFYITKRLFAKNDYFLEPGGTNVYGVLGYINGAFELIEQIKNNELPEPECIFCPVGTSGTIAGISLGFKLAGLKTKVKGVRVVDSHFGLIPVCTGKSIQKLMKKTFKFLKSIDPDISNIDIEVQDITGDYFGRAYGQPTEKGMNAIRLLKKETSIEIDPCYTSKAFAAVLDYCQQNSETKPVLFWNTYNSADLSFATDNYDPKKLPDSLKKYLEADDKSQLSVC